MPEKEVNQVDKKGENTASSTEKGGFFSKLFHLNKSSSISKKINSSQHFKLINGKIIKNVPEMIDKLGDISDAIFNAHVNEEKNDVSSWIRDVFHDPVLADKILKTNSRKKIISLLEKEVAKTEKDFKVLSKELKSEGLDVPLPPPSPDRLNFKDDAVKDVFVPPLPPKSLNSKKSKNSKSKSVKSKLNKLLTKPLHKNQFFSKDEHKEIDNILTLNEEKSRMNKKRSLLNTREKVLDERESKLDELEVANRRAIENVESLKKALDHDVRERINNLRFKDDDLGNIKSKLLDERKKVSEKDAVLDKLRKKYLEVISKERDFHKWGERLSKKSKDIDIAEDNLKKSFNDVTNKFKTINKVLSDSGARWDANFVAFSNLKGAMDIREREIKPILIRFEDDIALLVNKEKDLLSEVDRIDNNQKLLVEKGRSVDRKLRELDKKVLKDKKTSDGLRDLKSSLKRYEKDLKKRDTQLKRNEARIVKNKQLKEDSKKLRTELKSIEKKLSEKAKILIDIPKREDELKRVEDDLLRKKSSINRKEKEINSKREELSSQQKKYEEEMDSFMDEEFHDYLNKTLSKMDNHPIEKDDDYRRNELYVLIDSCHSLLVQKDFDSAKRLYNKIHSKFNDLAVNGSEADLLKKSIKDLYHEISLGSIS